MSVQQPTSAIPFYHSLIILLLPKYVAKKYNPYITEIIIEDAIIDGNKSFGDITSDSILSPNFIPNIECIIANISGTIKNIPICLNNALLIRHTLFFSKSCSVACYPNFLLVALMLKLHYLLSKILFLNKLQ